MIEGWTQENCSSMDQWHRLYSSGLNWRGMLGCVEMMWSGDPTSVGHFQMEGGTLLLTLHFHEELGSLGHHRACVWEFNPLTVEKEIKQSGSATDIRITVS